MPLDSSLQILKMKADAETDPALKAQAQAAYTQALEKALTAVDVRKVDEDTGALEDRLQDLWGKGEAFLDAFESFGNAVYGEYPRMEKLGNDWWKRVDAVVVEIEQERRKVSASLKADGAGDVRKADDVSTVRRIFRMVAEARRAIQPLRISDEAAEENINNASEGLDTAFDELGNALTALGEFKPAGVVERAEMAEMRKALAALPAADLRKAQKFGQQLLDAAAKKDESDVSRVLEAMRSLGQGIYDAIIAKLAALLRVGDFSGIGRLAYNLVNTGKAQGAGMRKAARTLERKDRASLLTIGSDVMAVGQDIQRKAKDAAQAPVDLTDEQKALEGAAHALDHFIDFELAASAPMHKRSANQATVENLDQVMIKNGDAMSLLHHLTSDNPKIKSDLDEAMESMDAAENALMDARGLVDKAAAAPMHKSIRPH